ncbi:MAG: hypothetical protein Q7R83_02525 [bacterium]|nr:hypothetical protein [bacterium]
MLYRILNYECLRWMHEMGRPTDVWLVMQGDYGGQIYLTVPLSHIDLKQAELDDLLRMLDHRSWKGNRGDGAGAYLWSPSVVGFDPCEGISGGMGGGRLTDGLWLHKEHAEADRVVTVDPSGGAAIIRPWAEKIARMLHYSGDIFFEPYRVAYDTP